jgi:hypothetical protein
MEKIRTGFIKVPEFKTKEEVFLWLDGLKPEDYTTRLTIEEEEEDKD